MISRGDRRDSLGRLWMQGDRLFSSGFCGGASFSRAVCIALGKKAEGNSHEVEEDEGTALPRVC